MAGNFGAQSTTDDVLEGIDLRGKRVVITGVSAGLVVETARALAAHGADVVGAARNLAVNMRGLARHLYDDPDPGGGVSNDEGRSARDSA